MKLYLEPVQMTLTATGSPARLVWRRKPYLIVSIEEQWLHCGQCNGGSSPTYRAASAIITASWPRRRRTRP